LCKSGHFSISGHVLKPEKLIRPLCDREKVGIFSISGQVLHCKKGLAVFPSPAGMSLIKLFLGGNNLVFPAQREFGQ
jgi:hypothetical protein